MLVFDRQGSDGEEGGSWEAKDPFGLSADAELAHEPARHATSRPHRRDDFSRLTGDYRAQGTESASSDWKRALVVVAAFVSTKETAYSQFRIPLPHSGYFISEIGFVCL